MAKKTAPHEELFSVPQLVSRYPDSGILPKQLLPARSPETIDVRPFDGAWQQPDALLERLNALTTEQATLPWVGEAYQLVEQLGPALVSGADAAAAILGRLDELTSQAAPLAETLPERPMARKVRRAGHALKRRLDIWRHVAELGTPVSNLAEPDSVDAATLLAHLERYERTRLAGDAKQLAEDRLALAVSADEARRRLAEHLDLHYRNANLRIAVTDDLMNRLMPDRRPQDAAVSETILGAPVRGRSRTTTDLSVRLLPEAQRVRLALEVTGKVSSVTSSNRGPATFYNNSTARYIARKPLEIDVRGIHLSPTQVDVSNNTQLRDVRTNLDGIPLVGPLAKGVARRQHEQQHAAALRESRLKIADRARKQIDAEVDAQLGELSRRLHQRLFGPMETLGLEPTVISAQTTPRRAIMRLRLAGEDQLGGNTPRPMAPSDSVLSFQIHETAMNNAIEGMALGGKSLTLTELARHVAERLHRDEPWEIGPANKNVTITFAKQNAVTVRCRNGRVELTLSIARLRKRRRSWKDFQVRAVYRPEVDGRSAELVRDGIIHFTGNRMSTTSQIALRGVFAKVFSKTRPIALTPERLVTDKKLAALAVTQFAIADGWIGVAYGPRRTDRIAVLADN